MSAGIRERGASQKTEKEEKIAIIGLSKSR